jgi:hypothetical protein
VAVKVSGRKCARVRESRRDSEILRMPEEKGIQWRKKDINGMRDK